MTNGSASVTIRIPTPLRAQAGHQPAVRVHAATVGEALQALVSQFPPLEPNLYDPAGRLRSFVNIYLGDEDIRYLDGMDTPVSEGAELSIVPSIAGGVEAAALTLTPAELQRYSRHLILPEVGLEGQQKLKAASVLIVGAGGLGAPLSMYLAAAGVGRIGLVDFDRVDESNLQRQLLFGTADVGRPKLEAAAQRLRDINPHVTIERHDVRLSSANALDIVGAYDLVADGTDNFPTRYLVNDACILTGTPNVYGSIFQFEGQVSVFCTPEGPSYRCIYPEPPPPGLVPSCAEGGVFGVLPGIVGSLQAAEVIKLITGIGEPLVGRLLLIDVLAMQFRTLRLRRSPDWPAGDPHPSGTRLVDYEAFCGLPAAGGNGRSEEGVPEITVRQLHQRRQRGEDFFLLDVRKPHEADIASIGGVLIPVDELARRLDELEPHRDQEMLVYCRSGGRSARAVKLLREHGFDAANVAGGILAWSDEIDPGVPKY